MCKDFRDIHFSHVSGTPLKRGRPPRIRSLQAGNAPAPDLPV
jgi:hypothetical protein